MGHLLKTAEHMIIDRALNSETLFSSNHKTGLSLLASAGLMLAVALGFFIYAGYLWLNATYDPQTATMLAGLMALALAVLCALGAYGVTRYKRWRVERFKNEIADTMHMALEMADEELAEPVRDNPKTALLIASLAGFIAGEKML